MKQFSEEEFQESFRLVGECDHVNEFEPVDEFDNKVLQSTLRHVRWRRRARRVGTMGLVLAVFGLGILCGRRVESVALRRTITKVGGEAGDAKPLSPNGSTLQEAEEQPLDAAATASDPLELRRQVLDAPHQERIKLLSEAGDIYLRRNELEEAVECYRQVIELTADSPVIEPDDSWLLAELKQSSLATNTFAVEIDR